MMLFGFRYLKKALAAALCLWPLSLYAAGQQPVGLALAQSSNCLSCHQVDRKVVGPAFSVIAERFNGNPKAADHLAYSIIMGSRGRWGPVPMPRQTHVSEADAQVLAQWILSLYDSDAALDDLLEDEAAN